MSFHRSPPPLRTASCRLGRWYDGQAAIRHRRFYKRTFSGDHQDEVIVGEYKDKDGFGGRFAVDTTASHEIERIVAVEDLNRRFGSG